MRFWTTLLSLITLTSAAIASSNDNDQSTSVADRESIASSVVNNTVNVITGNYGDSTIDAVIPGASNLTLSRSYTSGTTRPGIFGRGWHFNHYQVCLYGSDGFHTSAYITEKSGAGMVYQGKPLHEARRRVDLKAKPTHKSCDGLTNTGSGYIGGCSNKKNVLVDLNASRRRATVTDADGGQRFFKQGGIRYEGMTCREELLPSGNRLLYDTAKLSLTGFRLTNNDDSAEFANAQITDRVPGMLRYIELSDGRIISAIFDNERLYSVEPPEGPAVTYRYEDKRLGHPNRITRREHPDGRYLKTHYFHRWNLKVDGRPLHRDAMKRVRMQEEPAGYDETPIPTYSFFYDIQKKIIDRCWKTRGVTEVRDALQYRTDYHYDFYQRLSEVRKYGDNDELITRERLCWGDLKGSDATNLIATALEDADGKAISAKTFTYDERGNVLEECRWGNLTGNNSIDLVLDEKGIPVDNGCERKVIRRAYSDDKYNLLVWEEDPSGKQTKYRYKDDSNLLVAKITLADGAICQRQFFDYDENAAIIKEIADDGQSDDPNDLTGVTQRLIKVITPKATAPGLGLPEQIEEYYLDHSGEERLLKRSVNLYSPWGHVDGQIVYGADGHEQYQEIAKHNSKGQVIYKVDRLGRTTHYSYDANGNVTVEDPEFLNHTIHHSYDYMNRLVRSEKRLDDGRVISIGKKYSLKSECTADIDEFGNSTLYRYDPLGRLIEKRLPMTADGESIETYRYDAAGNLIAVTDGDGHTTEKKYNARGQVTDIFHPDGTSESIRYTVDGKVAEKTAANGCKTSYSYDGLGRPTCVEEWTADGELFSQSFQIYQGMQLVKSIDAEGYETDYEYDGAGRRNAEIHRREEGDVCTFMEYDALGRPYKLTQPYGDQPHEVTVVIKKYDALDRVIEEEVQDSQGQTLRWHGIEYDPHGKECRRITRDEDGREQSSWTLRNSLGHVIEVIDVEGNSTHVCYDYNYLNDLGQRVLRKVQTDPMGMQEETVYGARKQIERVERRNTHGQVIARAEMSYNKKGQRTLLRTAVIHDVDKVERWEEVTWIYDSRGRVTSLTEGTQNPRRTLTFYDAKGLKSTVIKPDGVHLRYNYDNRGRLADLGSSDGSVHYGYTYNRRDLLHRVLDITSGELVERGYDARKWITAEKLGEHGIILFSRDRQGRRILTQLPDKTQIGYGYDAAHLRSVIRMPEEKKDGYAQVYTHYDTSGKLLQAQLPLEMGHLRIQRDAKGRPQNIQTSFWAEAIPENGYNAVGNLTEMQVTDAEGSYTNTYEYNDRQQLRSESGHSPHSYAHDSIGNRIQKDGLKHAIRPLNQLASDGKRDYSYDANGNMVEVREDGKVFQKYHYDALDRLSEVIVPETRRVEFVYDAFHRRLHKKVYEWKDEKWRLTRDEGYLYEGQNEIASVIKGEVKELRILGDGLGAELGAAIAMELDGKVYLPIHDHRGNVTALVDPEQSKAVASYRYSAYGEETSYGDVPNPWRFSSKRVDDETGLVYFGRRYYQPSIGRWISTDPKGYDEGPNLYAYVNNQPLNHWDLYGLAARNDNSRNSCAVRRGLERADRLKANHSIDAAWNKLHEASSMRIDGNPLQSYAVQLGPREWVGFVGTEPAADGNRLAKDFGICNTVQSAMDQCDRQSKKAGGVRVYFHVYETRGFLLDCLGALGQKLNWHSGTTLNTAKFICWNLNDMESKGEHGNLQYLVHSRGTISTDSALRCIPSDYKSRVELYAFGGAKMIPSEGLAACTNYVGHFDPVSVFVGRSADYYNDSKYNVKYVGDKWKGSFQDHSFLGPCYGPVVDQIFDNAVGSGSGGDLDAV